MKKRIIVVLFFTVLMRTAAQDSRASFALGHYAAKNFTAGAVSETELRTVVQAGIRAPSAGNRQPWFFTVVRNQALAKRIVSDIVDGNVLIVVSAPLGEKSNGELLDCGLTAGSMYLAAQAVGLGSRIYTGPIESVNESLKVELNIPAGYSAAVIVRIGRIRQTDAGSSASSRNPESKIVTYKN